MIKKIVNVKNELERIHYMVDVLKPIDYEMIVIKNKIMKKLAAALDSVGELERFLRELEEESEPPLCLPLKNGEMSSLAFAKTKEVKE